MTPLLYWASALVIFSQMILLVFFPDHAMDTLSVLVVYFGLRTLGEISDGFDEINGDDDGNNS